MSNFDKAAQKWVEQKFGVTPDLGTVEFSIDAAAYASGAWCDVDVEFEVNGVPASKEIASDAWQYNWTALMRELMEIDAN